MVVFKGALEALGLRLEQLWVPYIIVPGTQDDLVPVANERTLPLPPLPVVLLRVPAR